jgi:hypothetical protein
MRRSVPAFIAALTAVCLAATGLRAQTAPPTDHVDDFTSYTFAQPAGGGAATYEVVRTFPAEIKSIRVTIVAGQADDIGYVGGKLVTDVAPACARVSRVTAPVEVTDQVTVNGNTASFTLIAVENCCCYTGWGSATEAGREDAQFHWEVELKRPCEENVCISKCAPSTSLPELPVTGSLSWKKEHKISCPAFKGEFGGFLDLSLTGTRDPMSCDDECKAKASLAGTIGVGADLCSGAGGAFSVKQTFSYSRDSAHEKKCDEQACGAVCDPDKYCLSQTGGYSVAVGATRDYPFIFNWVVPGSVGLSFGAGCKATVGVTGTAAGNVKWSENHGSADSSCGTCTNATGKLSLGGSATGSCNLTFRVGDFMTGGEGKDCAAVDLTTSFGATSTEGPNCPTSGCVSTSVALAGTLRAPSKCASIHGYRVKMRAEGKLTGSCAYDSCGSVSDPCTGNADGALAIEAGPNVKCP